MATSGITDMHFGLSPEQEIIVSTVRNFVEVELYPLEMEVERRNEGPRDVARDIQRKVLALGFYAPNMPESSRGGLDQVTFTLWSASSAAPPWRLRPGGAVLEHSPGLRGRARERYLLPCIRGKRSMRWP
jgi:acyl-CoA dehydrogenase